MQFVRLWWNLVDTLGLSPNGRTSVQVRLLLVAPKGDRNEEKRS